MLASIKKEFQHLKDLAHPNIVRVHELFIDTRQGEVQLVMETSRARSCSCCFPRSGTTTVDLAEQVAKHLFVQLLEGIRFLHRDLKPNNILLSPDGLTSRAALEDHRLQRREVRR